MKAVTMLNNGRFISDHGSGTTCYYDRRHKLIRTRLSGGGFAELIKELQIRTPNGRLLKKIQLQDELSVFQPPSVRPTAGASTMAIL